MTLQEKQNKLSYTTFLLVINILFIFIINYPMILGFILKKQIFDFIFYTQGVLIMIGTVIASSLFYYYCWKKALDHHKVVFWSFVGISVFYFLTIVIGFLSEKFNTLLTSFFIEGILLGLLIYVAEVELTEKKQNKKNSNH